MIKRILLAVCIAIFHLLQADAQINYGTTGLMNMPTADMQRDKTFMAGGNWLIEHSRHRSFNNFIANSLSAIAAYCFFEKKPAIDVNFVNDGQLAIF